MKLYFRMYRASVTLDGGAEELCHGDEDAAGDQDRGGRLVEELEAPVVDADLVDLEEAAGGLGHGPDQVRHLAVPPSLELTFNESQYRGVSGEKVNKRQLAPNLRPCAVSKLVPRKL